METSDGGTNAINATSKPRGTYLDPLKACALSGESGVNIGKSESATYTKYMNIVRQTRRTASRVSVLNDVERSRLSSVMRRIDGERAYSTAVMDRQKRQFKKSLESLDRHRSGLLRQIDEVITTPSHLRAKQSMLMTRRHGARASKDGTAAKTDQISDQAADSAPEILPKNEGVDRSEFTGSSTELPAVKSRGEKPRVAERNGDNGDSKGENVPVFYTGLGPEKLHQQVCMVHSKKTAKRAKTVTDV
ncbi:uncharacterized protein LOC119740566 isoform X2 [Patiria miniata]|uniref:Uncharacterized protein n=1 Tax=Patiria miniata TaxID=46514 RepID=A0A914B798_PATMI|nr:uncharacterized protein LOC119740566 isoform X2 [Patiria miniata]XP_038071839.1 uncharacterized protein LOC119740566 isoform X2 [Patiria miniata]